MGHAEPRASATTGDLARCGERLAREEEPTVNHTARRIQTRQADPTVRSFLVHRTVYGIKPSLQLQQRGRQCHHAAPFGPNVQKRFLTKTDLGTGVAREREGRQGALQQHPFQVELQRVWCCATAEQVLIPRRMSSSRPLREGVGHRRL